MRFLRREDINGNGIVATYLTRWVLFRLPGGAAAYVHRFTGDDWSEDLHDHPKWFLSVGLWGSYLEHTPQGARAYHAPWVRWFPADHRHRLVLLSRVAWTLVVVGPLCRQWGFWIGRRWVRWDRYVQRAGMMKRRGLWTGRADATFEEGL